MVVLTLIYTRLHQHRERRKLFTNAYRHGHFTMRKKDDKFFDVCYFISFV
jgi:hypothetical protein